MSRCKCTGGDSRGGIGLVGDISFSLKNVSIQCFGSTTCYSMFWFNHVLFVCVLFVLFLIISVFLSGEPKQNQG